jgi:hypothetical protein
MSKRLLEVNLSALGSSAQRLGGSERTCLMSGVPLRRMLSTKGPRKFQIVRKIGPIRSLARPQISRCS